MVICVGEVEMEFFMIKWISNVFYFDNGFCFIFYKYDRICIYDNIYEFRNDIR